MTPFNVYRHDVIDRVSVPVEVPKARLNASRFASSVTVPAVKDLSVQQNNRFPQSVCLDVCGQLVRIGHAQHREDIGIRMKLIFLSSHNLVPLKAFSKQIK